MAEDFTAGHHAQDQWVKFEEPMDRPLAELRVKFDIATDPEIKLAT